MFKDESLSLIGEDKQPFFDQIISESWIWIIKLDTPVVDQVVDVKMKISCLEDIPQFTEFERALRTELTNTHGQEDLFLRSSTGLSALLKEICHDYASGYFYDLVDRTITMFNALPDDEIALIHCADLFMKRLTQSVDVAPFILRNTCQYMLSAFQELHPSNTNSVSIIVGNFIILRILCPILIKPQKLLEGLPEHSPQAQKNAIQIAKLLQNALRGHLVLSNSKQGDSAAVTRNLSTSSTAVHAFVGRHADSLLLYLESLPMKESQEHLPIWQKPHRASKLPRNGAVHVKEDSIEHRSLSSKLFGWLSKD